MANEPIKIYKLIILYMLGRVESSLTGHIISGYIIDGGYTNFFNLQTAFNELSEDGLIEFRKTYNNSLYELTEKGQETLSFFFNMLSLDIREEIDVYLEKNKLDIVNEMAKKTDYHRLPNGEYEAVCSLSDKTMSLMELRVTVTTEKEAEKICNNFAAQKDELYNYLMRTLLK